MSGEGKRHIVKWRWSLSSVNFLGGLWPHRGRSLTNTVSVLNSPRSRRKTDAIFSLHSVRGFFLSGIASECWRQIYLTIQSMNFRYLLPGFYTQSRRFNYLIKLRI